MPFLAMIASGVLLMGGTIFALAMGISSARIEERREHEAGQFA